jgi:hypothetical protein
LTSIPAAIQIAVSKNEIVRGFQNLEVLVLLKKRAGRQRDLDGDMYNSTRASVMEYCIENLKLLTANVTH